MSRVLPLSLVALALVGAVVLGLTGPASAATPHPQAWSNPDLFLARYGLPATSTTIVRGPRSSFGPIVAREYARVQTEPSAGLLADLNANGGADGVAFPEWSSLSDVVMVADDLGAHATAYAVLHEVGHRVSVIRGDDTCAVAVRCERAWRRKYEEGLVDAWTSASVARYWRFLSGRRMDPVSLPAATQPHYRDEARAWRAAAKAATGQRLGSSAVREYLTAALLRDGDWRELALCDPIAAGMP